MATPNGRDLDLIAALKQMRSDLDELTSNVVGRWGRVPHVSVDPTAPPNGAVWIRSDTGKFCFQANGTTIRVP